MLEQDRANHNTCATMRFDDPNNAPLLLNVTNGVLLTSLIGSISLIVLPWL